MHQAVSAMLGILSLLVGSMAMAVDVTTCDPLPAGETGILQGPLSCSAPLELGKLATLDLNGFTLSGGVDCNSNKCSVVSSGGTGTVIDGAIVGRRLKVSDVVVDCNGTPIGIVTGRSIKATNVTVLNCTAFGIHYGGATKVIVRADGLNVINNRVGMELNAGTLVGTNVNVSDNTIAGVYSGKIKGEGFTATGNGTIGLGAARQIKVSGANVSGNGEAGIWVTFGPARLKDSSISGNGVDIATGRAPRLKAVTCTTSRRIVGVAITPESWLACPGE